MRKTHTFRAVIEDAGGGGAFVTIPFDVERVFGKRRVKVKATLGGEPYQGSLVRMGGDCHILGVRKDIRAKLGKSIGDEIEVVLTEDVAQRVVTVPADLQQALNRDPAAGERFQQLSYTHRKEQVDWITNAKRAETRQARISRTLHLLQQPQPVTRPKGKTMPTAPTPTIDSYIAGFPPDVKVVLRKVRATIQKAAPDAQEAMKYGIPTYTLNGNLVHFAAFANHIGFYPTPSGMTHFQKELSIYKSAKGSVQFPLDRTIPYALIAKIVKFRVQESLAKAPAKRKPR